MKFLRNFETMAAYNTATINRPSVSLIEEGFMIKYDPVSKIFDFNPRYLYSDLSTSQSYDSGKTLIGIEVVPGSHTPDKKARFMSVRNMSLEDPENGTLAIGNDSNNPGASIMWGAFGDIFGLSNQVPGKPLKVDESGNLLWELETSEDALGYTVPGYFPIDDLINSGMSPEDIEAIIGTYPFYPDKYYVKLYGNNAVLPYPFTITGAREDLFAQPGTVLTDMDGAGNTAKIIAAATATETSGAISNDYSEGHFPAAMACYRYRGGNLDSWYLPSMGELVYAWVNIRNINTKLSAVSADVAVNLGDPLTGETLGKWLWSSSVNDSWGAWRLNTSGGDMYIYNRNDSYEFFRVRAFLSLAV
jgi:hypothetical protein